MGLRDFTKNHMTLGVCMLGARGVGKTSIMTAMFDDARSSEGFGTTRIAMTAKPDTRAELYDKKLQLQSAFDDNADLSLIGRKSPSAGIEATAGASNFHFEVKLVGKPSCIDLVVSDYPGEFLVNNKEFVAGKIAEASAIMVAIDTPFLMEKKGKYNEDKNQVELIRSFLAEIVDSVDNKLIMFVPLKCEKYFYEDRMDEVNMKVREAYAGIMDLFADVPTVAMVITPILTMGGVVFDRFETVGDTHVARYEYYQKAPHFHPMFSVQPIYYLLSFVSKLYYANRRSVGFWKGLLQGFVSFFDKNEEFILEMKRLEEYRMKNECGYSIISGNKLL